jgi:hypothetical protein
MIEKNTISFYGWRFPHQKPKERDRDGTRDTYNTPI